ncbi:hypothetical protein IJX73_00745 [bacterium]|nr:hypothetical protein [bacterium]MBQ9149437.1 hypothetical protein [bacterium]
MDFNCTTQPIENLKQPYKEAPRRNAITDGLSEEAMYYMNQAVNRTSENGYKIFDENGLMPENYDFFNNLLESNTLMVCDYGEDGTIYTADERFLIENNEDNSTTVHYDSDGLNGYDRTATYQNTVLGNIKTKETFNADGDKINEAEISRNIKTTTTYNPIYQEVPNPDHTFIDSILNIFGFGKPKTNNYIERMEPEEHYSYTKVSLGINADDLGYDDYYGNHFEYKESVDVYSNFTYDNQQEYIKWKHADKSDHFSTKK